MQSKDQKLASEQWKADWEHLMEQGQFRRVLWSVMEKTRQFQNSYTSAGDSGTSFNEGMRSVGLWLRAEAIKHDRKNYIEMIKENLE